MVVTFDNSKDIPQARISERIWLQVEVNLHQERSSEPIVEQTVVGLFSRVREEITEVLRLISQECFQRTVEEIVDVPVSQIQERVQQRRMEHILDDHVSHAVVDVAVPQIME